jgi:hypothetical protein
MAPAPGNKQVVHDVGATIRTPCPIDGSSTATTCGPFQTGSTGPRGQQSTGMGRERAVPVVTCPRTLERAASRPGCPSRRDATHPGHGSRSRDGADRFRGPGIPGKIESAPGAPPSCRSEPGPHGRPLSLGSRLAIAAAIGPSPCRTAEALGSQAAGIIRRRPA